MDELGGTDDFPTEALAARLARDGMINWVSAQWGCSTCCRQLITEEPASCRIRGTRTARKMPSSRGSGRGSHQSGRTAMRTPTLTR